VGNEPFAVLLPDDLVQNDANPCLKQMIAAYEASPASNLVAVEDVPREKTKSYGILDVTSQTGNIIHARSMVEKPSPELAPSTKAVIGRYILQPSIFDYLSSTTPGAGGEIQLTDAIKAAAHDGVSLNGLLYEGQRHDCGDKAGFLEANLAYALARPDLREKALEILERYHAVETTLKASGERAATPKTVAA
jgi:UTP--glucose-1-phosphate uridylyltransferase